MDAEQIEDDIENFKNKIVTHQKTLTDNSEWFFVMVLGFGSVSGTAYQVSTFIIIFIFFLKRTFGFKDEFFPTTRKNIIKKIQLLPNLNERNALSYKLNTMHQERNGAIVAIKRTWLFILSWIFLIITVFHIMKVF